MPTLQSSVERVLVMCGLWMLIGFVCATAVAVGVLQLFDGEANWLLALALIVCGGVLTAASWHRGRAILDHADEVSAISPEVSSEAVSELPRHTSPMLAVRFPPRFDDDHRYPTPE